MNNTPEFNEYPWVDIADLRVGMFIHLDLSWLEHPFPLGSFRIVTPAQIETLRGLGLEKLRYEPAKSTVEATSGQTSEHTTKNPGNSENPEDFLSAPYFSPFIPAHLPTPALAVPAEERAAPGVFTPLQEQQRMLAVCDQHFSQASMQYQKLAGLISTSPAGARAISEALVCDCVTGLLANGESAIQLLSEGAGGRNALHSVNVMVISLLLGKALGMVEPELMDLGMSALLHDLGMIGLPAHLRPAAGQWTAKDKVRYQGHVEQSVAMCEQMALSEAVLAAIAQHHEMADGSGFPLHLVNADFSRAGRVVALVNHYDRMCHPLKNEHPLTPHEALSVMFSQMKPRFDAVILGAFIRMMGVYPPGSIVELVNDRQAIVVSVNSARPLRPKVIVYDPAIPQEEALIIDLEKVPNLGIRRCIKPSQLTPAARLYLSPRQRICYFFEKIEGAGDHCAV